MWSWKTSLRFLLVAHLSATAVFAADSPVSERRIAAIVTVYTHNSHADVIVSRLLQTDTLDGKGNDSPLKLVSIGLILAGVIGLNLSGVTP